MFVLCPHCHFLVGMDPRTGGPPAACPKCGGTVVEPVAATRSDAPALDPFAEAALPSVLPTLPAAPAEETEPAAKSVKTAAPPVAVRGNEPHATASGLEAVDAPLVAKTMDPAAAPALAADVESATDMPAVAAPGDPPAVAEAPATRPSADEMIAALGTRPARKPRAPRTRAKKPAAPPPTVPDAHADTPLAVAAPGLPVPAPSAAASLGARLRRLFARAPRQPGAATGASLDAASAPAPEASPDAADATPATPALSIRNRRRRPESRAVQPAAKPAESESGHAPVAPASAATDTSASVVEAATAAAEPAVAAAAMPDPAFDMPPVAAEPRIDVGPIPDDDAGAAALPPSPASGVPASGEAGPGGDPAPSASGPEDATIAPPENIDAAAAALVAGMPAPPTQAEAIATPARPAPSFASSRATAASTRRDHRALAAAVALAGLLGLQLLLAQRAVLAADPGWRPAIATLCGLLRCALPPWREPAAFTMLSRHVRPHPDAPGTLLIDASFRNDARWPQPWPRLELTLADVDGRTVGARTFDAREYLGAAPTQSELAPGQSASLSLAVVEPAPDIVSFTFDFR